MPIKAIVLNLLSVGAAYGVLVLVFQDGLGESLLGFHSNGGVSSWLPLFLFVILFGLSMDYHVLILSRVREAVDRGLGSDEAVREGITATAGTVTSAAIVMVAVFSIFATLSILDMKEMGIGLAAAILIDATIVRAILLPATMKLLGDRNWYLPSALGWLPRVESRRAGGRAGARLAARSGEAAERPLRSSEAGVAAGEPRRPLLLAAAGVIGVPRGSGGCRVPLGPGGDLLRAADPLAVVGLEGRHRVGPRVLLDLFPGRGLDRPRQRSVAERVLDVGVVAGFPERLVGDRAGVVIGGEGRVAGGPADVEIHGASLYPPFLCRD